MHERYLQIDKKTIYTPIIEIIKDIRQECHNGKLQTIKPLGDDIQVSCPNPNHKGGHESKPSGGIYIGIPTEKLAYGFYHCFTCDMKCDFVHFTALCFESSDAFAKKWLLERYYHSEVSYSINLEEIELTPSKKEILSCSILDSFQDFHPYMRTRNLSQAICEKFRIKYDPKTKCLVFPVWDEKNNLVMLTRRSVIEKKFIIDKNKEKPLYLLNHVMNDSPAEFMITEGQIDALTAYGYGMPCVATMGAISEHQIDLINKSGVRVLYLMFDNDYYGNSFKEKLLKSLRKEIFAIPVPIISANKKDINELTKEEFNSCLLYAKNNCII